MRLLLVLFAAALATPAIAFDSGEARVRYTVTSWTERDGMPSSFVRDIAQDRDGYLWLATYSGLVRFDGTTFVAWPLSDGSSLASEDLSALWVARDGSLWIGGGGGVARLVGGAIDLKASSPKGFFRGRIFALLEDRAGHIWAAGQSGIATYDGTEWRKLGRMHGLPDRVGQSLREDSSGRLWIGTSVGLYRRVENESRFEPVPSVSFPIDDLEEDAAGSIVIPHPTQLFSIVAGPSLMPAVGELGRTRGMRLLLDHEKQLWIGTRGQGLVRLRGRGGSKIRFDRITTEQGLSADSILALFEDREGNIWVGTQFGLSRLSASAVIPVLLGGETSPVLSLASDKDGIWVGTEESLLYFVGDRQVDYDWSRRFPNRAIIALQYDSQHATLWISTNRGMVRLTGGSLEPFATAGAGVLSRIRSIVTDDKGRLWLCDNDQGVFRSTDRSLARFELVAADNQASTAVADRDGRVWVGSVDGTVRSYGEGQPQSFSEAQGLLGGAPVNAIHQDRAGTLWVGTHRGLSRYRNGRFVTLTKAAGFPGAGPVSIVDDAQGDLWLGVTGVGIVRMSPAHFDAAIREPQGRLTYRLYGPADGLRGTPIPVFGTPIAVRGVNGQMWFQTGNSVAIVDPSRLNERPVPPVVIESLLADDRQHTPGVGLELPSGTSTLQFDYTVLSLAPVSQLTFRYKLEGFDSEWTEAGRRRQAFFTHLPPGAYRFVVEATDGSSPTVSRAWPFSIRPRFYQTSWFAVVVVMITGIGVWGLWQLRLHQMHRRFALVINERARMAREIHDTLLQGLVGITLQIKVIAEQLSSSPVTARERLERVRKLAEEYTAETRQSIKDLRSPWLQGRQLGTALREAGDSITADRNVRFDLVVRGTPHACPAHVEEQLMRIGREAMNNAVRHAHPSRIRVELAYEPSSVRLHVADDGVGFDPADPQIAGRAHWGLTSMRERAAQINARLHLASRVGGGTELELIVPLQTAR